MEDRVKLEAQLAEAKGKSKELEQAILDYEHDLKLFADEASALKLQRDGMVKALTKMSDQCSCWDEFSGGCRSELSCCGVISRAALATVKGEGE